MKRNLQAQVSQRAEASHSPAGSSVPSKGSCREAVAQRSPPTGTENGSGPGQVSEPCDAALPGFCVAALSQEQRDEIAPQQGVVGGDVQLADGSAEEVIGLAGAAVGVGVSVEPSPQEPPLCLGLVSNKGQLNPVVSLPDDTVQCEALNDLGQKCARNRCRNNGGALSG